MKTTAPVAALCGILLAASLPTTEAQIISINFNQAGTTATNAGSLGGNYNVTLRNNAGTATDLHSADGTGVSGLAGDRAFDERGNGFSLPSPTMALSNPTTHRFTSERKMIPSSSAPNRPWSPAR